MIVELNYFDGSVKYINTKGFPMGIKRVDKNRIAIMLTDYILVCNATEVINTINDVMGRSEKNEKGGK